MVIPVVHCVISEHIELLLCYWHGYDISDMDSMVNVLLTLFRVLLIDLSLPNIFNCKLFRYIFAIFFGTYIGIIRCSIVSILPDIPSYSVVIFLIQVTFVRFFLEISSSRHEINSFFWRELVDIGHHSPLDNSIVKNEACYLVKFGGGIFNPLGPMHYPSSGGLALLRIWEHLPQAEIAKILLCRRPQSTSETWGSWETPWGLEGRLVHLFTMATYSRNLHLSFSMYRLKSSVSLKAPLGFLYYIC